MTRRLFLAVLAVATVAALLADRASDPPTDPEVATLEPGDFPIAAPVGAPSSTWFCAGGTADEESFADHVVTVLNPNDVGVTVTVTVYSGRVEAPTVEADTTGTTTTTTTTEPADEDGGDGEQPPAELSGPVTETVELGARRRTRLVLRDVVSAPIASALVEADAGGVVVEHEVSSIHGFDAKPCVTAASDQWHFAWGSTERFARELLVLFNPFPADAIVDGRFSTDDGVREPARFDGLVVPGGTTVAFDLGDDVTRRSEVAASITARTGRLVVDRILRVNDEAGRRGLTIQSGVTRPQLRWVYPDGYVSDAIDEVFTVYNPSEAAAEVEIAFVLDRPEVNGIPEPVVLALAPGAHAYVDVGADERIPSGVAHTAVVRSENGVPVVAERVLYADAARRGISVGTGSPVAASTWMFAAGGVSDVRDQWLIVANPDAVVLTEIDVYAIADGRLVPVSELQDVTLEAGQRRAFRLSDHVRRASLPIIVVATEPVVAERGWYAVGDERGFSQAVGVPDPAGVVLLVTAFEFDDVEDEFDLGGDEGDDVPAPTGEVDLPDVVDDGGTDDFEGGGGSGDGSTTTTAP